MDLLVKIAIVNKISTTEAHLKEFNYLLNGWQLAKMKKGIPDMSLP